MIACCDERIFVLVPGLTGDMDLEALRRYVSGESDAGERAAVARWLAEDPSREQMLDAVRQLMEDPQALAQRFDAQAAWARVSREAFGARDPVVRVRTPTHVLSIGRPRRAWSVRRIAAWGAAAAAAVALGIAVLRGPWPRAVPPVPEPVAMRTVATLPGRRARVTLGDGTQAELAPGSRLSYPAVFSDTLREVALEGEAYFDVRHDPARHFQVRTRGGVTEDVGTAFVVRQYADDAQLRVVVASGRVAVRGSHRGASAREARAGQMVEVDSGGRALVRAADLSQDLAWMQGRLVFRDTPFREVLRQLARWYDADLELADSGLGDRRFTGAFHGEPLDSIAGELAAPLHVRYNRHGRTVVFSRITDDR